jgi:hypothetical protein
MMLISLNVDSRHDRNAAEHDALIDQRAGKEFCTFSLAINGTPRSAGPA